MMMPRKIAIGCDHAGYELKELIKQSIGDDYLVTDFGTNTSESVDYPDHVHPLATSIQNHENELGILICGSGNGVCMTANKHKGIRAALCWNEELAALARQHNNANIICLPARFIDADLGVKLAEQEYFDIGTRFLFVSIESGGKYFCIICNQYVSFIKVV